jgi:solute carrier family 35 (UDP-galactose transporter), member B1
MLSLFFDGVTGVVQERLNSQHSPNSVAMMSEINKWSVVYLTVIISATPELRQLTEFVGRHPDVVLHLLLLSLTGAVGQFFVYVCLSDVGPLQCTLITTTRKLVTVLASVILFGNPVSDRQLIGAAVVFTGLFLDTYFGKRRLVDGQERVEECSLRQFVVWCC